MGQADWDRLCVSQWDRQAACTKPVPLGLGKVKKRPLLVPWDKSYNHAAGLSLSQDKLYTHDGACPSSTCPNLSHKVGLQGRGLSPQISPRRLLSFKGGPEPLEKEIHEILGSKCEDRFSDPFF